QNWNVNLPTGQLFGPSSTYSIKADGQLMTAAAFRPLMLSYHQGSPVRLEQVAKVIDSVEDPRNASWTYTKGEPGGQRNINLQVMRQPGSNTIAVTDAVRAVLNQIRAELPPA